MTCTCFSPPTTVPGTELRLSCSVTTHLYALSHLLCPTLFLLLSFLLVKFCEILAIFADAGSQPHPAVSEVHKPGPGPGGLRLPYFSFQLCSAAT